MFAVLQAQQVAEVKGVEGGFQEEWDRRRGLGKEDPESGIEYP